MVETDTVFQVTDGVLDLGMASVVGLELHHLAFSVGDEGVVGELDEQRQLAARCGPHPAHDEPTRPALGAEGLVGGLGDVGAVEEVGDGDQADSPMAAMAVFTPPLWSLAVMEKDTLARRQASTTLRL